MTTPDDMTTFNDLSEKYATWIIKYCSPSFELPLFLIWYTDTDENSTDRLLTFKGGEIFATTSLSELMSILRSEMHDLMVFENLDSWLANFTQIKPVEYCSYDLVSVKSNIGIHNFDLATMNTFADFINLYNDFVNQDERNIHLKVYSENEIIKETWHYFYNYIFWPEFNKDKKYEVGDRPPWSIDPAELSLRLENLINTFDKNIRPIEKAIC